MSPWISTARGKPKLKPACHFSTTCSRSLPATGCSMSRSRRKVILTSIIITPWKMSASCLGQAFKEALGDKHGIRRFGEASCPLDETLAKVVVDLSGRPYLSYNVKIRPGRVGDFDTDLPHEFYAAFTNQLGMNLHMDVIRGENPHHIIEACFKAFARAMDMATQLDGRIQGVLSTKGSL